MEAVPYIVEQRIVEAHHEKYDQYHILKLLVPFDLCIENIYSYQQYGKCTAVQVHTAVKLLALYRLSQDKHLLYHIPYASVPLPFREMSGGRRRGVKPDISRDQQKRRHSRSHDRCSRKSQSVLCALVYVLVIGEYKLENQEHTYHETYIVVTQKSVEQTERVQSVVAAVLHHLLEALHDKRKYQYTVHPHEIP